MEKKQKLLSLDGEASMESAVRCTIPAEGIMVLGAITCTVTNSLVGYVDVPLLELLQGRYIAQWLLSLGALVLRRILTKQPIEAFGPAGVRHWLLLYAALYYGFVWLWWGTLRLVPVGD